MDGKGGVAREGTHRRDQGRDAAGTRDRTCRRDRGQDAAGTGHAGGTGDRTHRRDRRQDMQQGQWMELRWVIYKT